MGDDGFDVAVLGNKGGRRLFADTANAGDVVGAVAGEGEVVDHLRGGGEAPVGADLGGAEDFGGGLADAVEEGLRVDELGDVLVARHEVGLHAVRRPGRRRVGAHEVVGLEAVGADDRDAHGRGELLRHRDGGRQVLGHLLALGLVGGVGLVAEGRRSRILDENDMRGRARLQNLHDGADEARQRGGVDARRGHARVAEEGEVAAVEKRHDVNDVEGGSGHGSIVAEKGGLKKFF